MLTLQLLLQERSVGKVAKKLALTSSTVSKSLSKLREWFDDPLFVKTPQGFEPTPLALALEQELTEWQQLGSQIASRRSESIPNDAEFHLCCESPLVMTAIHPLCQAVYSRFTESKVKLHRWDYDAIDAIVRGDVDVGFSGRESHPRSKEAVSLLPDVIEYETLFVDTPTVFLRHDHPALKQEWDLDAFLAYPHIGIVWEQQETWALDEVLADRGLSRHAPLVMTSFEQALFMAAQSGNQMLTTAPGYCRQYCETVHPELVCMPIPLNEDEQKKLQIPFTLMWHKRNRYNPKIEWLRQQLSSLFR